jgi:hypothetical protein
MIKKQSATINIKDKGSGRSYLIKEPFFTNIVTHQFRLFTLLNNSAIKWASMKT